MLSKYASLLTTIVLIVVFYYSGFSKIILSENFLDVLQSWSVIPKSIVPVLMFGIPFLELIGAIWLSLKSTDWRPRIYVAVLLLIFTTIVLIEHNLSGSVSCGCFGEKVKDNTNIVSLLIRNSLLLTAALVHPSILNRKRGNNE